MLSNRPYLLRAFYQWIVDSNLTPILVLDATQPRCKIPMEYVEEGEIVFNISPSAIRDLNISNDVITFKASFSGIVHIISVPTTAVLAIYAEENGEGIFLDAEEDNDGNQTGSVQIQTIEGIKHEGMKQQLKESGDLGPGKKVTKTKPFLRLVE